MSMSKFIPRNISDNYLRNGGLELGYLRHWQLPTGFLSYSIPVNTNFGGGYCIRGLSLTGNVVLEHNDYIPVREGEHIDISNVINTPVTCNIVITLKTYTASLQELTYLTDNAFATTTGYNTETFNFRVPKNVAYIKVMVNYLFTGGNTIDIGDFSLRIQDSRDSIETITQIQNLWIGESIPVSPGGYRDYVFSPTDTELYYRIKGIYWNIPAVPSSSTGAHYLTLLQGGDLLKQTSMSAAYNQSITYEYNAPTAPYGAIVPSNELQFFQVIRDMIITEQVPLYLRYTNNTNGTHNVTRDFKLIFETGILDNLYL